MKKLKKLEPVKRTRQGHAVTFHLKPSLMEPLRVLGDGVLTKGINNVLNVFEEEILRAAEKALKAS